MARAVVLFSGGLDSMLAVRVLQRQAVEVEALHVVTLEPGGQRRAAEAAARLAVPLHTAALEDDYLEVIRHPRFGSGRGANPCIDCRIRMCQLARRRMEESGADLVASGEVLGQRPKSQKRLDLTIIARHSGLEGRLLRPLSALLLPITAVEAAGLVERQRLYRFAGAGRKGLIALAGELGIDPPPGPSSGCLLTRPEFGQRVRAALARSDVRRWDIELLSYGRHCRLEDDTLVVVGRHDAENQVLIEFVGRDDAPPAALMIPENFLGPSALLIGPCVAEDFSAAAALVGQRVRRPSFAERCFRLAWSPAASLSDPTATTVKRWSEDEPPATIG